MYLAKYKHFLYSYTKPPEATEVGNSEGNF